MYVMKVPRVDKEALAKCDVCDRDDIDEINYILANGMNAAGEPIELKALIASYELDGGQLHWHRSNCIAHLFDEYGQRRLSTVLRTRGMKTSDGVQAVMATAARALEEAVEGGKYRAVTDLMGQMNESMKLHGQLTGDLVDRKSTRLNSSHIQKSRMPSSA